MAESGAKAALRGYRLQALYVLALVLREDDPNATFHLEGHEDVDVYINGVLTRAIQVKAHQDGLSLSDFKPRGEDSFLRRAAVVLERGADVQVTTFGPVGPELAGAWAGEVPHRAVVTEKLVDHGFEAAAVARLFERVRFVSEHETEVQQEVFAYLSDALTGTDPVAGFELLSYWLYRASEDQQRITRADVIERVTRVGRYLAERAAHHAEWFTSIVPLLDEPPPEERAAALAEEFRLGVSARYEHILAEQDVIRTGKLEEIETGFSRSRVVLVHGASGQGKTTLALRYLHDYVPAEWRFYVRAVQDRRHALQVASALAGHLRAVAALTYVHVDVSPRDLDWPDLVRALLAEENVRVLVTIREEDLARLEASDRELDFPAGVPLELGRTEAKGIYARLEERRPVETFLSFDDAWSRFGEKGPLLEFVHLVTESESLEQTLRKQVDRLRTEHLAGQLPAATLMLLRVASIAGAYEARVELRGLVQRLGLDEPEAVLARLEKEYLLRTTEDRRFLESLHPLRSAALSRVLEDPELHPWEESAAVALDLMPERDLEGFLLHAALHRGAAFEQLLDALASRALELWTGLAGVARAVLWWSLRRYTDENAALIEEARGLGVEPWIVLAFDVAGIADDPYAVQRIFLENKPEALARVEALQAKQTNPSEIWAPLGQWLATRQSGPRLPETPQEWASYAEVAYWCLREGWDGPVRSWVQEVDLTDAVEKLPVALLGDIFTALMVGPEELSDDLFARHGERLRERCREEMRLLALVEEQEGLRAHFIVPLLSASESASDPDSKRDDRLNSLASECVLRLGQLVPGYDKYGTFGYGWRVPVVEVPYDPTHKMGALKNFGRPRWGVRVNSIFLGLIDLRARLDNWKAYVEEVLATRKITVDAMEQIRDALIAHFGRTSNELAVMVVLSGDLRATALQRVNAFPKLPRTGIDPWGRVWEGQDLSADGPDASPAAGVGSGGAGWVRLILERHRGWLDASREYRTALSNFLSQCTDPLMMNSVVRQPKARRAELIAMIRRAGYSEQNPRLSLHNLTEARLHLPEFQQAFRERYGSHARLEELDALESRETEVMESLWSFWYAFINGPGATYRDPRAVLERAETEERRRLCGRLESALRRIPRGMADATILSETVLWEGRPALWIAVEVSDPLQLLAGVEAVHGAVRSVLGRLKHGSLEAYAAERAWPRLLLVPTLSGKRVLPTVWRFATANFYLGYFVSESITWIPVPLPRPAATELLIEALDFLARPELERFEVAFVEFYELVAHLADVARVPVELDETGKRVESSYAQEIGSIAENRGKAVADAFAALHEAVSSAAADGEVPILIGVLDVLADVASKLRAPEEVDEEQVVVGWEEGLRDVLRLIGAVRLALVAHTTGAEIAAYDKV
jgi:hypothetical protein